MFPCTPPPVDGMRGSKRTWFRASVLLTYTRPLSGGGVQGNIVHSQISVINGTVATPHHLNPHIDYTCVPPGCPPDDTEVENSLAFPGDLTFSSNSARVYVTGFGSQKIGIFDTNALESGVISK